MQENRSTPTRKGRCPLALGFLILSLVSLSALAQTHYIDTFNSAPSGNWTNHITTGTDEVGLDYQGTCPGMFAWLGGTFEMDADAIGDPDTMVITSRAGGAFTFKSIDLENTTLATLTITGIGPEPFTISVPGFSPITTRAPAGGPKLVTSVRVSSDDFWILFDNVDVIIGDTTKPDVTIDQATGQADPTNSSPVLFTAVFNEPIDDATFTSTDVSVGGTATMGAVTITEIAPNDDTTFEVSIVVTGDGTVIPTIPAGGVEDLFENTNNVSTSSDNTVTYDATDPTDPTPSSSTHAASVWSNDATVLISWSGASDAGSGVVGYSHAWDTNPTTTPDATQDTAHTADPHTTTSPVLGNGNSHYFHIRTLDAAGNWTSTQHLGPFQIDTTPPSVPTGLDPVNGSYYAIDASPILSWTASTDTGGSGIRDTNAYRIVVTGPVSRDAYVSDTDYNPTLSEGTFTWKVYARDNAGNTSSYTANTTLYIDETSPDVTIDQAGGQADPATSSPVAFTVVFDEPIDDATFTSADVSVGGTATTGAVTVTEIAPNDDTTFEVTIDVTDDGTVIPTIPAGGIEDYAGNTNTAATSTDNSVTVDISKPSVTIDQAAAQADPTNAFPVTYTAVFSEPINVGTFSAADIQVGGSYVAAQVDSVTEVAPNDGTTFEVSVIVLVPIMDGTITASIDAGDVEDLSGNTSYASTSTDNSVTMDTDPPGVVLRQTLLGPVVTEGKGLVIADAEVAACNFGLIFTYDEPMDMTVAPTLVFPAEDPSGTIPTICMEHWQNDTRYLFAFDVVDVNVEIDDIDVRATGAKDIAGNVQIQYDEADVFDIDTLNPTAAIWFEDTLITDADVGLRYYYVNLSFSEDMDTTGGWPTWSFSPNVTTQGGGTGTLGHDTPAGWTSSTTFQRNYAVFDTNDPYKTVDLQLNTAYDLAGNLIEPCPTINAAAFVVDTENPTVAGIAVSDIWLDELDVGGTFTVTVDFAENMTTDGSADPLVAFAPAVATTLTTSAEGWVDSNTWEVVYNVADSNTITFGIDIDVTGGKDAVGNAQVAFDTADCFDIDTKNPPPGTQWLFVDPAGSAGPEMFLDRCIEVPEGEEAPMAGACELNAIFEVGEAVTGGCNVRDVDGCIMRGTGVHVWVYSVDTVPRPEVDTLLDHWTVHYDGDCGAYAFAWDTTDYAPGIYDIRLGFEDSSAVNLRVELTAPEV